MSGQITFNLNLGLISGLSRAYRNVSGSSFFRMVTLLVTLYATLNTSAHADAIDLPFPAKTSVDAITSLNAIINEPSISSRVLGGAASEPGEWPSVVALVRPGLFSIESRLFCGGTIVAERWVMTAAHCLFNVFGNQVQPSSIRVVAGITDLRNEIPDEETIVTTIIVHPEYEHDTESIIPFDIALLELGSSLDQPAATLFTGESEDHVGVPGFIAGWGATQYIDENNAVFPSMLQDATVPLVSNATCNDPQSYNGAVSDNQLCAGFAEGGVDACVGDSGGPLFIVENGQQVQVGITGFGNGCALPLFYGIYTNVSHFIPWLGNYIDVPFQSPELIAERQAAALGHTPGSTSDSDNGFFGASVHPLVMILFGSVVLFRRRAGSTCLHAIDSRSEKTQSIIFWFVSSKFESLKPVLHSCANGSVRFCVLLSRQLILLLSGGCLAMATASCSVAGNTKQELVLASNEGRVGLRSERLGVSYTEARESLRAQYPNMSECSAAAVTVRGTGRLSMQVQCEAIPESVELISGLVVQKIDYVFLDEQLVRIVASIKPDKVDSLKKALSEQFESTQTTASSQDSNQLSTWRSGQFPDDRIELKKVQQQTANDDGVDDQTTLHLQFIDGRLEGRLPSLFNL